MDDDDDFRGVVVLRFSAESWWLLWSTTTEATVDIEHPHCAALRNNHETTHYSSSVPGFSSGIEHVKTAQSRAINTIRCVVAPHSRYLRYLLENPVNYASPHQH